MLIGWFAVTTYCFSFNALVLLRLFPFRLYLCRYLNCPLNPQQFIYVSLFLIDDLILIPNNLSLFNPLLRFILIYMSIFRLNCQLFIQYIVLTLQHDSRLCDFKLMCKWSFFWFKSYSKSHIHRWSSFWFIHMQSYCLFPSSWVRISLSQSLIALIPICMWFYFQIWCDFVHARVHPFAYVIFRAVSPDWIWVCSSSTLIP